MFAELTSIHLETSDSCSRRRSLNFVHPGGFAESDPDKVASLFERNFVLQSGSLMGGFGPIDV